MQSNLPVSDGYRFPSYETFNQFVVTNAMFIYNKYKSDMSQTTTIRFRVHVYYISPGASGLVADRDIGQASQITENSFSSVDPTYLASVVAVTNLERFSVSVQLDSEQQYIYSWNTTNGQMVHDPYPPHPDNLTKTNLLILNEWYSVADAMARITLANASQTNVYTQHGSLLRGGALKVLPTCLEATIPRGADVSLESSPDLINWMPMEFTLPWYLGTERASVPIDTTSSSRQFYRAFVR